MITQDYTDKRVLVTGAASGIGRAQAEAYLAAGATVIGLDRQPAPWTAPRLTWVQLDLTDRPAVEAWLAQATDQLAQIDVFLSTAGILDAFTPAGDMDLALYDRIMAVNLTAPVLLTKALLPHLLAKAHADIVYMASIAGQVAGGGGAAYTTSKHALVGWMRQLALDYANDGLHVNAIAPGAIETPMNAADFAGDGAMAKSVAAQTPIQRWAQPQEVADLTLFMTSPQASYMQGQVLTLDGGWTIK